MSDVISTTGADQLKSVIDRIENLENEKSEVSEQIKEVYSEARGSGFDVKILRKVVRLRKQSRAARQEEQALLETYLAAIGEVV